MSLDPYADPEPGSLYGSLEPALRETLQRSFVDRVAGLPETEQNLMFGFPAAPRPPPRTTWEALDNLGLTAVNLLVRLFDRIKAIDPTLTTWKQIKYIRNQWWGGSAGIKVVYWDPAAMRTCLDGLNPGVHGNPVARDWFIGAMEHQLRPMPDLLKELLANPSQLFGDPPDCDTWREVSAPGMESAHFCIDRVDIVATTRDRHPQLDDLHLDWKCPVKGIDPETRKCSYAYDLGTVEHWLQATRGKGNPVFVFQEIDDTLSRVESTVQDTEALPAELNEFAQRWRCIAKGLAVRGKSGYDEATMHHRELSVILERLSSRGGVAVSLERLREEIKKVLGGKG